MKIGLSEEREKSLCGLRRLFCFLVLCIIACSSLFAWQLYESKDVFGDPSGNFKIIDSHIDIYFTNSKSPTDGLSISFGSSEYGFYQAKGYIVELKEEDGSVHSYYERLFSGEIALDIFQILLRNTTTKVYVFYNYGYGQSFTYSLSNKNLLGTLEMLLIKYGVDYSAEQYINVISNSKTEKKENNVVSLAEEASVEDIVAAANKFSPGQSLDTEVTVSGLVIDIPISYSAQYKDMTVNIKVGALTIQCYRLSGDGCANIKKGDTITVKGIIQNYKGTIEFNKPTLVSVGK